MYVRDDVWLKGISHGL